MSSSAFTPSTTTVTNNVPVNVPVVTAWEAFTPSFAGLGTATFSQNNGYWRRVGDSIEVEVGTVVSTVGSGSTAVSISLPNSLTVDWSKLSEISGSGQAYSIVGVGNINTASYNTCTVLARQDVGLVFAKQAGGNLIGSELTPSTTQFSFNFKIPVSQWAGSGTTTLATRAVEEYAFNTSTSTTTSDTTSFGYGPQGAQIGAITAFISRRVNFRTPILSTDSIIVEFSDDRVNWRQPGGAAAGAVIDSFRYDGTNFIGMGLDTTSSVVSVFFGRYRTGTNDIWAGTSANLYWRVRKVSGGAQVGFPVSARNIVGDTSGSVVPTGMLGEKQEILQTSLANCGAANQFKDFGSITLGAGVWSLNFVCMFSQSGSNISVCLAGIGTVSGNSGTGQVQGENAFFALPPTSATDNTISIPNYIVSLSSSTTFYGKVYATYSSGTPQYRGRLTAIRIA